MSFFFKRVISEIGLGSGIFVKRVISGTGFGLGMGASFSLFRKIENNEINKDEHIKEKQDEIYKELKELVSEVKTFIDAYDNDETNKDFIIILFWDLQHLVLTF